MTKKPPKNPVKFDKTHFNFFPKSSLFHLSIRTVLYCTVLGQTVWGLAIEKYLTKAKIKGSLVYVLEMTKS